LDDTLIEDSATFRLVIRNQFAELRPMSAWLSETIKAMGGSDENIFNFDLCANEAVTNIISYGYTDQGEHEIILDIAVSGDVLCLSIEDDGSPFNPLEKPEHISPHNLEEAQIGGLGVDLILKIMKECHYTRINGKNIFRMCS
jgi:serine/threonine-protein kinase RsbW